MDCEGSKVISAPIWLTPQVGTCRQHAYTPTRVHPNLIKPICLGCVMIVLTPSPPQPLETAGLHRRWFEGLPERRSTRLILQHQSHVWLPFLYCRA